MMKINQLYGKKNNENCLKSVPAKVVSYDADTGYAVCRLAGKSTDDKFINKSGEMLSAGDSVQIWYFTQISAGFVGLRCGKPIPLKTTEREE